MLGQFKWTSYTQNRQKIQAHTFTLHEYHLKINDRPKFKMKDYRNSQVNHRRTLMGSWDEWWFVNASKAQSMKENTYKSNDIRKTTAVNSVVNTKDNSSKLENKHFLHSSIHILIIDLCICIYSVMLLSHNYITHVTVNIDFWYCCI